MKERTAEDWLKANAERLLRKVGMAEGQRVLDFGCGSGNYAIPAARIVGRRGVVYALDKDTESLDKLMAKAGSENLSNVRRLGVEEGTRIPLADGSVDVVLLYDVFHLGYLPERDDRRRVLSELHRVLSPAGLLSCYPTHLKQYGMTFRRLRSEFRAAGFRATDNGHRRAVVHDGELVRGRLLEFRKRKDSRTGRAGEHAAARQRSLRRGEAAPRAESLRAARTQDRKSIQERRTPNSP
jgi:ubiquinone/menaquinone biosynthesis C-methylase UbiE